jgi:hypothetical protein
MLGSEHRDSHVLQAVLPRLEGYSISDAVVCLNLLSEVNFLIDTDLRMYI